MNIKEDLELYFGFIQNHLESIKSIDSPNFSDLYKKLCYSGFIDLLSRLIYPKKSNRERIVAVLKKYSNWQEGYNISLPHLLRLLKKTPDPDFEDLRLYAKEEFKKWSSGELVELDRDLQYEEVKKLWPKHTEYKILLDGVSIDSLTLFHLFYTYRNSLVHELRPPSSSFDREYHEHPFYMHLTSLGPDLKPKEHHWVLSYPVRFFNLISENLFNTIKDYYCTTELNPYDMFISGNYWLDSLNKS